jgi:cysteine desulfurase / selenocysteine lyase
MNIEKIREDFPILNCKINEKKIIYLDSTATSLKPIQVIKALEKHYSQECANIHRGLHLLSQKASESYENARKTVAGFINASEKELAFTKNTTESLNFIANSLLDQGYFKKDDEILVSIAEHHSNFLPWKKLESIGVKIKIVNLTNDFLLDLNDFELKLNEKTKLVSLFHMSNTIAAINPVKELTKKVHEHGALMCIDAAQSSPHLQLNVKNIDCDFMAFSAHKMLGPTGIGALYVKEKLIQEMHPLIVGGGMISNVSLEKTNYLNGIEKFEAGTPNIAGAYGFEAACNYLNKIGMHNIRIHEKKLTSYAFEKLNELNNVELYCNGNPENQGGIILFSVKGIDCHDTASLLNEMNNIAVRSGHHCAQPLMKKFNKEGLVRASFYLYTTEEEIDLMIESLKKLS